MNNELLKLDEPFIKQDTVSEDGTVCLAVQDRDGVVVAVKFREPDNLLEMAQHLRLLATRMQDARLGEEEDDNND